MKSEKEKVLAMIGMAYKAKKVISGDETLKKSIKENKIKLLIIAEDASENTKKRFVNSAIYYNIPFYIYLTKQELSISLNWKNRSVVGITDTNFSNVLGKLIGDSL